MNGLVFYLAVGLIWVSEVSSFHSITNSWVRQSTRRLAQAREEIVQIPLLSSRLNGSFTAFQDAEDLVLVVQSSAGKSSSGAFRTYFMPSATVNATDQEQWRWWQRRKMAEKVFKSAVSSNKSDISSYFNDYKQYLVADKAEVLQTHDDFFRAIHRGDFEMMRSLWLASNETLCLPKGSFVYTGTQNIFSFWASALSTPKPHISIRNVRLNFQGDLAVVTCQMDDTRRLKKAKQRRASKGVGRGGGGVVSSHVTSIFMRPPNSDRYLITAHIASTTAASASKAVLAAQQEVYTDPSRLKRRPSRNGFGYTAMSGMGGMGGVPMGMAMDGNGQPVSIEGFFGFSPIGDGNVNGLVEEEDEDDLDNYDDDYGDDDSDNDDDDEISYQNFQRYDDDGDDEDDDDSDDNDEDDDDDEDSGIDVNDDDEYYRDKIRGNIVNSFDNLVQADIRSRGGGSSSGPRVFYLDPKSGRLEQVAGRRIGPFKKGGTSDGSRGNSRNSDNYGSSRSGGRKARDSAAVDDKDDNYVGDGVDDNGEGNADDSEEKHIQLSRALAARAVETVRHLADQGRIPQKLRQRLTRDVIESLSRGKYSKTEVAFALILGPGRPEDALVDGSLEKPFNVQDLDPRDLTEFCDLLNFL